MRKIALMILCLTLTAAAQDKIAWYGSWDQGRQAALETGRPIMLVAAAVQCRGVSGIY